MLKIKSLIKRVYGLSRKRTGGLTIRPLLVTVRGEAVSKRSKAGFTTGGGSVCSTDCRGAVAGFPSDRVEIWLWHQVDSCGLFTLTVCPGCNSGNAVPFSTCTTSNPRAHIRLMWIILWVLFSYQLCRLLDKNPNHVSLKANSYPARDSAILTALIH